MSRRSRPSTATDLDGLHLLGTSGTVTTLAGIYLDLARYDRRRVDGIWLSSRGTDRHHRTTARCDELPRPRRQPVHRRRARRSGAGRLRHPRRDPSGVPAAAAPGRRPRPARGHAGADDARGRRDRRISSTKFPRSEARARAQRSRPGFASNPEDKRTHGQGLHRADARHRQERRQDASCRRNSGWSASSTIPMWRRPSATAIARARPTS